MRLILSLVAVALSFGVFASIASAQECAHCDDWSGSHYFILQDQDPYYDCNGECHTNLEFGSCSNAHDPCLAEEDAQDLAEAIRLGDASQIDDLVAKMSSQLEFVPQRGLVVVRGCQNEYVAGFSLRSSPLFRHAIELVSEQISLVVQ